MNPNLIRKFACFAFFIICLVVAPNVRAQESTSEDGELSKVLTIEVEPLLLSTNNNNICVVIPEHLRVPDAFNIQVQEAVGVRATLNSYVLDQNNAIAAFSFRSLRRGGGRGRGNDPTQMQVVFTISHGGEQPPEPTPTRVTVFGAVRGLTRNIDANSAPNNMAAFIGAEGRHPSLFGRTQGGPPASAVYLQRPEEAITRISGGRRSISNFFVKMLSFQVYLEKSTPIEWVGHSNADGFSSFFLNGEMVYAVEAGKVTGDKVVEVEPGFYQIDIICLWPEISSQPLPSFQVPTGYSVNLLPPMNTRSLTFISHDKNDKVTTLSIPTRLAVSQNPPKFVDFFPEDSDLSELKKYAARFLPFTLLHPQIEVVSCFPWLFDDNSLELTLRINEFPDLSYSFLVTQLDAQGRSIASKEYASRGDRNTIVVDVQKNAAKLKVQAMTGGQSFGQPQIIRLLSFPTSESLRSWGTMLKSGDDIAVLRAPEFLNTKNGKKVAGGLFVLDAGAFFEGSKVESFEGLDFSLVQPSLLKQDFAAPQVARILTVKEVVRNNSPGRIVILTPQADLDNGMQVEKSFAILRVISAGIIEAGWEVVWVTPIERTAEDLQKTRYYSLLIKAEALKNNIPVIDLYSIKRRNSSEGITWETILRELKKL